MSMNFNYRAAALATALACASGCGSATVGAVRGQLAVDGAPAEVGTLSFRPADGSSSRGAGAAISGGQFQLAGDHGLMPGKYMVSAQLSKSTGKTVNDPQMGPTPVMAQMALRDSPQEVELSASNASELSLEFHTK